MSVAQRRMALWGALAIVVVALVFSAFRSNDDPASRAQALAGRIACPVCTGESVAESNAPVSVSIRADIRARIDKGESDQQILDFYAQRFPSKMLTPPDRGIGLVAWGLPVIAVLGAAAGLGFALVRWRRQPRMVASAADEALVAEAREES